MKIYFLTYRLGKIFNAIVNSFYDEFGFLHFTFQFTLLPITISIVVNHFEIERKSIKECEISIVSEVHNLLITEFLLKKPVDFPLNLCYNKYS